MKKEKNNKSSVEKYGASRVYMLVSFFVIIVVSIVLYNIYNGEEKYLVNKGTIEYTTTCLGYIIKDETIIDIDNTKILIPTVTEGSRVSKNNIIATYRGAEYDGYQDRLQQIDNKILEAMKDIDVGYSIEVTNLENQVINTVISAKGISSMIEMQECKTNINNLLSKRAAIIGELSPEEAYVKDLIKERESIETALKTSPSNIKAPIGGIVSYNVDGLEDKLTEDSIMKLNYEDVKEYVSNSKVVNNKIKISSNYEAYILVRVDNVDKEYIENVRSYKLKVMGAEVSELEGNITKITETEQGYEILFRVTNGIENIIDSRQCEVEVVWTDYEGLVIPIKAIKEDKAGKNYVTIITRGDYIDIPVIVKRKNSTYAIVENYEKENVNDYILERYDRVIMQSKQY